MNPTTITIVALSASTAVLAFLYIRAVMRERTTSINNRINEIQDHMWRESDIVQEKIKDMEVRLPGRKA